MYCREAAPFTLGQPLFIIRIANAIYLTINA